ncbi:ISL3 family transposase [Saccharopolyspora sp. NPDC050389]|uniref:ISL3 family transposase n=1 Tax=Saccharopolyspora sp. NPDC050389 TaxID=3155516 RepID=UPI0033DD0109
MLGVLFPHLAHLRIDDVHAAGPVVRIEASTLSGDVACPGCGTLSDRVHSRYERRLSDTATSSREVLIRLRVRRLFCDNTECAKKTFAEGVQELAARYGRRTTALERVLCAVALALGGRAGARLTQRLAAAVSRMTLLRMVRALPDSERSTPRVLGVDDFALCRGHHYGTILIDVESRRPVDVLTDRTAETLTAWLQAHPGVEIVCRDRAGAYAEGVREGAPDALQVADRWHVWNNLAGAVERTVARHQESLRAAVDTDADPGLDADADHQHDQDDHVPAPVLPLQPQDRTDRIATRTRERYAAIHALLAEGVGIRTISARLGLARGTVRRFARADAVEELLTRNGTGRRPSLLEEFKPYLHQRFNDGATNAAALFAEIKARGYRGGQKILREYLRPFRTAGRVPEPPPKPPSVRRVVGWIMSDPSNMESQNQRRLDVILAASPQLAALAGHVRAFATMMCGLRGHELEKWMAAVDADDQPALHSFVVGIRRDQDAVTAGLTLPYNSGPVEGHVNRIKMIKRQMFGRAKPDLLRKRILLSD